MLRLFSKKRLVVTVIVLLPLLGIGAYPRIVKSLSDANQNYQKPTESNLRQGNVKKKGSDTVTTNNVTPQAVGITSIEDMAFRPVSPCRIIDTRTAGGKLAAEEIRHFMIAGNSNFEGQGGLAGGCGIPFGMAGAVSVNITAVSPAGAGYVRMWPFGDAAPNATLLNYSSVLNASNGVDIPLCDPFLSSVNCDSDVTLKAFSSATHIVVDVVGYYTKSSWAVVTAAGGIDRSSTMILGVTKVGTGEYDIELWSLPDYCSSIVSLGDPASGVTMPGFATTATDATNDIVRIRTYNTSGTLEDKQFHFLLAC